MESKTIGSELVELFLITGPGEHRIWIKNAGAVTTNAASIQGRNSRLGSWKDLISSGADFKSVPPDLETFLVLSDSDVSPTALAAGQEWNGTIDTSPLLEVRMVVSVASGSTEIQLEVN